MKKSKPLSWILANTKRYIPAVVLVAVLSALISVGYVLLAYISGYLLDIATGEKSGNIYLYIGCLFALILGQAALYVLNSSLRARAAGKTEMHLKSQILQGLIKKEYSGVAGIHSGDILTRFTSDVSVVVNAFIGIVPNAVSLVARLVVALVVIASFSPKLMLFILSVGIVVGVAARFYSILFKKIHKRFQEADGKTRSYMQECTENLVAIKAFGAKSAFSEHLGGFMSETYKLLLRRNTISNVSNIAVYILFTGGYYAALVWGAFMISGNVMTYGVLMTLLNIVSQIRTPITGVSGLIPQYFSALASAERIMELEDIPDEPQAVSPEDIDEIYKDMTELTLRDITFSYDGVHNILSGADMSVKKGEAVALKGTSGEGKSTILRMLLGLYKPTSGSLMVSAGDRSCDIDPAVRGLFAYVPQGNMIFSGSIAENIRFCKEDATDEEVYTAARCADIYDFIMTLPDGFDTVVGERGTGLSEGQVQRIAIARAVLSGAPILLLDECTSSLDEKTERRVLENIKSMTDRTIIIISHRPLALELCDKVYELRDGVATESK